MGALPLSLATIEANRQQLPSFQYATLAFNIAAVAISAGPTSTILATSLKICVAVLGWTLSSYIGAQEAEIDTRKQLSDKKLATVVSSSTAMSGVTALGISILGNHVGLSLSTVAPLGHIAGALVGRFSGYSLTFNMNFNLGG